MKKVKFILPVVAVVFAVAGVWATPTMKDALAIIDITLHAGDPCDPEGWCDTSITTELCKVQGTNIQAYDRSGSCLTTVTGRYSVTHP